MEYNYYKIGEKIFQERKRHKLSQQKLIDKLYSEYNFSIGRNTLSSIENGICQTLPLQFLICFSDITKCDIGYFLGEYDARTRENQDISDATGLSKSAVETLKTIKSYTEKYADVSESFSELDCLNYMMHDDQQFLDFLDNVASYIDNDFTTPLHYENNLPVASQQPNGFPEITIGKPIGEYPDGKPMYTYRGMPLEVIETHFLLEAQNSIRDWKNQYQNEK